MSNARLWHFVFSNLWRKEQKCPYNEAVLSDCSFFYSFVWFFSGLSLVVFLIFSVMEMVLSCLSTTTKEHSTTNLVCSNSSIFFAPSSSTKRFADSLRRFQLRKRGGNPNSTDWQFLLANVSPDLITVAFSFCPRIKICSR